MGFRPSTSMSSGQARGSRSHIAHPSAGDQSSHDAVGPLEPVLGHKEYLGRREVPGSDASLPGWGFRRSAPNAECFDDEAGGDLGAGGDGSQGGIHLEHGMLHEQCRAIIRARI